MPASPPFVFASFFDALHDEAVILDAAGRIVTANAAWKAFCAANGGDTGSHYVGTNYLEICQHAKGDSSAEAALIPAGLRGVLETGAAFRCEYPCDSPTVKRWFEMIAARLDHGGKPFLVVQHRNITTRKEAQQEAHDAFLQAEIHAALVAASSDAIITYDLDGIITTWNAAAERLYGYTSAQAIGQSMEILYPPNWPKRITEYRDEILAGKLNSFEAERMPKRGPARAVWVTASPIRSPEGNVVLIANIHRDITDVRRAEQSRDIIAHEVVHRAKNMLTVVSAIHRQTARSATSMEDFNVKFGARIQALSTSTDLLVSGNWTTVALADLVGSQTAPFFNDTQAAIQVSGPPVVLQPQAVQVIGMALHELSTNSAKHGALRSARGRIEICWDIRAQEGAPRLVFDWSETGIEATGSAGTKGFGNTVLTMLSQSMLDAAATFRLYGDTVQWTLSVPGDHFAEVPHI